VLPAIANRKSPIAKSEGRLFSGRFEEGAFAEFFAGLLELGLGVHDELTALCYGA
jgi:hypothetical protein